MQRVSSILLISMLSGFMAAAEQPVVDESLTDLRLANEARKQQAEALAEWETERQRLELLVSEAQRQEGKFKQQIASDQKAVLDIQQRLKNAKQQSGQAAAIDAALLKLSDEAKRSLDRYHERLPSGSVAVAKQGPPSNDAAMMLLHEVSRIQQSIANGKQWRVSISAGILDGTEVAYDQLSMGHVCAWWLSRDSERGGVIERRNGKNYLIEIRNKTQVKAIKDAIAVAQGDRAPSLIPLPIQTQQLSEQAGHP